MPRGGARPGSGPKRGAPRKPRAIVPVRAEAKPRAEFVGRMVSGEMLTPIEVLQSNMEFYFNEAGQILAAIQAMGKPQNREQATDQQFEALLKLADHFRMRDKAGDAAAQLARFVHRSLAPKPYDTTEDAPKKPEGAPQIEIIPTPPAVLEAVRRAAAGLPPEPRKTL